MGRKQVYFEKNLEALKKKSEFLYDKVIDAQSDELSDFAQIERAKNGEALLTCNSENKIIYMNSRYNPSYEAKKRMAQYGDMKEESYLFIFGLSNGAYIREFLEVANESVKCIVYEPCLDIFLSVLRNIDITTILESDRVILCVKGLNENLFTGSVSGAIQVYNKDTNRLMGAPRYIELFYDDYLYFKKVLIENHEKFYILQNAVINYGKRVVKNDIYNMKFLKNCRSGIELKDAFPEDMSAIVVAAGPSLEKNVHELIKAKGKALIIVVDTAIKKLYSAGVVPDMFSAVDFEKPVSLFEQPGINEVPMLSVMDFNTEVFEYLQPTNLFFCDSDSLVWDEMFKKAGSEICSVNLGGSVATFTIAMLIAWGFKRIIMVGQDLAMTGNKVHAGEASMDIEYDERYTFVKGIEEESVAVRKDYYMYLQWIENVAGVYKNIDFIDATEGGALKKNTRVMKLSEAIEKYCNKHYDIESMILKPKRLFIDDDQNIIKDALRDIKKELRNVRRKLLDASTLCRQAKLSLERNINDKGLLKKAANVRKKTDEMLDKSKVGSYITKYLPEVEILMLRDVFLDEEDDIKEAERFFEKSSIYYSGLAEGIPNIIKIIEEFEETNEI